MSTTEFNQKTLDDFEKVELNLDQRKIFAELTGIIANKLGLMLTAVKWHYRVSLIKWQKTIQKTVKETEEGKTTPEKRKQELSEIFDLFSKEVEPMLIQNKKTELLKPALEKAFQVYSQKFANR
ncbi:MAG: hypothetical protein ACW981_13790 [Candidatus Hodarchaeales archaeon]